jgi:hypothetical protein
MNLKYADGLSSGQTDRQTDRYDHTLCVYTRIIAVRSRCLEVYENNSVIHTRIQTKQEFS